MLVLMCDAAGSRFAVDARQVVEVVPRVRLQSVANGPDWLTGICVYRGRVTPVMDLAYVVAAKFSAICWANRIVLLRVDETPSSPHCGLLVEKVSMAQLASVPAPQDSTSAGSLSPWGPLLLDAEGMFQLLELPRLFTAERRRAWLVG